MKSVKKAIIAALCAGTLVVGSVAGTMAYLTSTDEVVNTFTVGNVAITLDETDVDINGAQDGTTRVTENQYKLVPGHTYIKDPKIHVAPDSEDCYLFVKVKNEIDQIEGGTTVAQQMANNSWVVVSEAQPQPGETVYVYTKNNALAVVKANEAKDVDVFSNFTIKGDTTKETLASYAPVKDETGAVSSHKTITVTAYAIQADGFGGKTAAQIWSAANFQ